LKWPLSSGFFNWDFGLAELPREAGIIVIRGPRQYGKSTCLEYQLRETLRQFGPGTALFLNGDYIGPRRARERYRINAELFWRTEKHEIDFFRQGRPWIEVKAGHASPFEFDWFIRTFSREKLLVVSSDRFDGSAIRGVTLEDFLLDESL
jgi:predicted AAA+ superfamily ATPase